MTRKVDVVWAGVATLAFVLFGGLALYSLHRSEQDRTACIASGGVPMRERTGDVICFKKEFIQPSGVRR